MADPWAHYAPDDGEVFSQLMQSGRASDRGRMRAASAQASNIADTEGPRDLGDILMLAAGGPIANAASKLSPSVLASLAAAYTGLAPSEANSQAALRKSQQRELEMQRRQKELEAESARRTENDRLEGDIKRQSAQAEQDRINQQLNRELQEKIATEDRNKTFQEKYPGVTNALPAIGLLAAAGIPYASRAMGQYVSSAPVRAMNKTVAQADRAAVEGNAQRISDLTPRLQRYNDDVAAGTLVDGPSGLKEHLTAGLAGGVASAEATMFPEQWNYQNLPDGPRKDKAKEIVYDPVAYLERGGIGAISGMGALHFPMMKATPRTQDSLGIVDKYGTTPTKARTALDKTSGGGRSNIDPTAPGQFQQQISGAGIAPQSGASARPLTGPEPRGLLGSDPGLLPPSGGASNRGQSWPIGRSAAEQKAIEDEIIRLLQSRQ